LLLEAWRDPEARLFGFTCEVFSEAHIPKGPGGFSQAGKLEIEE
jgi:hypothetical protein